MALLDEAMREGWTARHTLEQLEAAGYTDRTHSGVQQRLTIGRKAAQEKDHERAEAPFLVDELPEELPPVEELLARRRAAFQRKAAAKEARKLIGVDVRLKGPFAIAHMGDPHVDDDGTDISLLERHVEILGKTEGMLAGNVGDITNNWIGRLARLYGEQATNSREAWALAEWLIRSLNWLYIVGGNHDAWSGSGDPLRWIAKQGNVMYQPHGARMGLRLPGGRVLRINARHTFPGHSMWNPAHGVARAAQMGTRDHILTCGHTHVSGYQLVKCPGSGLISHAIQTASYKTYDKYAEEKGFRDQTIHVCPVTVIRPEFDDADPRLITFFADPESAADYLTYLRRRAA